MVGKRVWHWPKVSFDGTPFFVCFSSARVWMYVCLLRDVVGYIFPHWLGTFITCTMHMILPHRYVRNHFGSRGALACGFDLFRFATLVLRFQSGLRLWSGWPVALVPIAPKSGLWLWHFCLPPWSIGLQPLPFWFAALAIC